jgi:glutamine amidotransferase
MQCRSSERVAVYKKTIIDGMKRMCRLLGYLGNEIRLANLIFDADQSLAVQAYSSSVQNFLNVAGIGFSAWQDESQEPRIPFAYHSTELPMYDRNLQKLSNKITANCLVGHIRATGYTAGTSNIITIPNVHPFQFKNTDIVLAHNGGLVDFDKMKFALADKCDEDFKLQVEGNTDSEWIYALLLSKLKDASGSHPAEELADATLETLTEIKQLRDVNGINTHSAANLVISDGSNMIATCFTYDFGCYDGLITNAVLNPEMHSLWYSVGSRFGCFDNQWAMAKEGDHGYTSMVLASEPLTKDVSSWMELQKYTMLVIDRSDGLIRMTTREIDL